MPMRTEPAPLAVEVHFRAMQNPASAQEKLDLTVLTARTIAQGVRSLMGNAVLPPQDLRDPTPALAAKTTATGLLGLAVLAKTAPGQNVLLALAVPKTGLSAQNPDLKNRLAPRMVKIVLSAQNPDLKNHLAPRMVKIVLSAQNPDLKNRLAPRMVRTGLSAQNPDLKNRMVPGMLKTGLSAQNPDLKSRMVPGMLKTEAIAPGHLQSEKDSVQRAVTAPGHIQDGNGQRATAPPFRKNRTGHEMPRAKKSAAAVLPKTAMPNPILMPTQQRSRTTTQKEPAKKNQNGHTQNEIQRTVKAARHAVQGPNTKQADRVRRMGTTENLDSPKAKSPDQKAFA